MEILNGRYGPYISYKGNNYRLPKSIEKPELLSMDECKEIIEKSADKTVKRKVTKKKS